MWLLKAQRRRRIINEVATEDELAGRSSRLVRRRIQDTCSTGAAWPTGVERRLCQDSAASSGTNSDGGDELMA